MDLERSGDGGSRLAVVQRATCQRAVPTSVYKAMYLEIHGLEDTRLPWARLLAQRISVDEQLHPASSVQAYPHGSAELPDCPRW